jgi:hypothetical protein
VEEQMVAEMMCSILIDLRTKAWLMVREFRNELKSGEAAVMECARWLDQLLDMFRSGMAVLPESVLASVPGHAHFGWMNNHLTSFVSQAQKDLGIVCRRPLPVGNSSASIQKVVSSARELWKATKDALSGMQNHLPTEARQRVQGRLVRVVFPIDQDPLE